MNKLQLQTVYIPTEEAKKEGFGTSDFIGKYGYFLTEEQLKQLLEEYTNRIVENVKMKVQPSEMEEWEIVPNEITREDVDDEEAGCEDFWISVDKKSITSQLEPFLKEML